MTETEPEFDSIERGGWYDMADYEDELCHQCGMLKSICSDPGGLHGEGYYPQRDICYVTRAGLAAQRAFDEKHKEAKPSESSGWLTDVDGVNVWPSLIDLTPEDDFLD